MTCDVAAYFVIVKKSFDRLQLVHWLVYWYIIIGNQRLTED